MARYAIVYQWQVEREDMLAEMAESDPESNQYMAAEEYLEELEHGLRQSGRLAMLMRLASSKGGGPCCSLVRQLHLRQLPWPYSFGLRVRGAP